MGAFNNSSDRRAVPRWLWRTSGSLVATLLVGCSVAGSASAAEGEFETRATGSETRATQETEAAVSTSPVALGTSSLSSEPNGAGTGPEAMPLTRAASQQRVDQMNPITWLQSYGAVTIGRSE